MSAHASQSEIVLALAEEFLERYRQGQRPSLKEYIDRRPELAAEIKEVFPAMALMENIALAEESLAGEPAAVQTSPLQQLGDFRILREVGHGGMGVVYEAEQVSLGRHVALKVLPQQALFDSAQKRRFQREAKAAAKLHHTNIVPVFGVGEHEGLPYYVMQFIPGRGLDEVIEELRRMRDGAPADGTATVLAEKELPVSHKDVSAVEVARSLLTGAFQPAPDATTDEPLQRADAPPTPAVSPSAAGRPSGSFVLSSSAALSGSAAKTLTYWQSVARIGVQVANALEHAHRQGIHHRDIKPSNLLLDTHGTVWVTDFGLAKADDQQNLTHTGDVLGTLRYMPPEAFEGRADARGDVYSLGLTLYELLSLRPAFDEKDRNRLMKQVTTEEPPRLDRLSRAVPRDLVTIVHKAIDRESGRRYQTAAALAADLQRFLDDEPIQARPMGRLERAWRWMRRRPATAALLAVSAVATLALVGVVVGLLYNHRLEQANEETRNALEAESTERQKAEEAQRAEQEQRERAEMYQYFHHVGRAHAEWRDGSMGRVEQLLDDCPPGPRGWEWHYLKRLCHADSLTLRGVRGGALGAAFSPEGTRLASALDMTVRLWDLTRGEPIRTFQGHNGVVRGVAFSPDGTRLASASADRTVKLWETATGQLLHTLQGHTDGVRGVAFSLDGKRLASAGADPVVRVWDVSTGRKLGSFQGEAGFFQGVAFSPDGTQLAAGGGDRSVTMWVTATGRISRLLRGHTSNVTAVTFSPDGSRLASGSWDNAVKVWDLASGKEVFTLKGHAGYIRGVAFSPDGALLASAGVDQAVRVWDMRNGQEVFVLKGHASEVASVAFSPEGARLASSSADGTVRMWAATPQQEIRTFAGHADAVRGVVFSPDGKRLASASADSVRVWDVRTGQELHRLVRGPTIAFRDVAFSPDGKRLAVTGSEGTLLLWEPAARADPLVLRGHEGPVTAVAFSPDGAKLASAGGDSTVRLWDAGTGRPGVVYKRHTALVRGLAFRPDGKRLASAGEDTALTPDGPRAVVRIWEAATGREVLSFPTHEVYVASVAFSPDGRQLATGGWDNQARLWDATTGEPLLNLPLFHNSDVWCVAFSPDGKRLASGSADQTVKVWDTATGQEALSLKGHAGHVWAVAFSPDGSQLASASEDQTVKVWDATALTPEVRAEREALALLEFLFAKPLRKADVLEHLRNSPTTNPQVRQRALILVQGYREETDPKKYHDAAWPVLRHPYANVFVTRFALAQVKAACDRAPDQPAYRIALGVAQYRLGKFRKEQYSEALATLSKCDPRHPTTLAFLAMTQRQLGEKAQARATLDRLRQVLQQEKGSKSEEAQAFLREATALLNNP
jgi:WD40 repeat protein